MSVRFSGRAKVTPGKKVKEGGKNPRQDSLREVQHSCHEPSSSSHEKKRKRPNERNMYFIVFLEQTLGNAVACLKRSIDMSKVL